MQTKDEVKEKLNCLLNQFDDTFWKEIDKLLESSIVNLSAHNNDFVLPKILYVIALKRIGEHYAPLTPENKEMLREIEVWA